MAGVALATGIGEGTGGSACLSTLCVWVFSVEEALVDVEDLDEARPGFDRSDSDSFDMRDDMDR